MDAGGSGDPYAGLDPEQAAALREVTRLGFPLRSWFGHKTMGVHAFTALYGGMLMADPGYFEDFWTKLGYLGFDNPASLAPYRLQFETVVTAPLSEDQGVARGLSDVRIPAAARRGVQALVALTANGAARRRCVPASGLPSPQRSPCRPAPGRWSWPAGISTVRASSPPPQRCPYVLLRG